MAFASSLSDRETAYESHGADRGELVVPDLCDAVGGQNHLTLASNSVQRVVRNRRRLHKWKPPSPARCDAGDAVVFSGVVERDVVGGHATRDRRREE